MTLERSGPRLRSSVQQRGERKRLVTGTSTYRGPAPCQQPRLDSIQLCTKRRLMQLHLTAKRSGSREGTVHISDEMAYVCATPCVYIYRYVVWLLPTAIISILPVNQTGERKKKENP